MEAAKLDPAPLDEKIIDSLDPKGYEAHPVSEYSELNIKQTVRIFWKATIFCFLAAWAACNDGYAVAMPGLIVVSSPQATRKPLEECADHPHFLATGKYRLRPPHG